MSRLTFCFLLVFYIVIVRPTLPVRRFEISFLASAVFTSIYNLLYVLNIFYRAYVCVHFIVEYHDVCVEYTFHGVHDGTDQRK